MSKKTIWITGGSTGIGKALAIKFAAMGWNVAISARRAELLNELSNSYENISGFPLDLFFFNRNMGSKKRERNRCRANGRRI